MKVHTVELYGVDGAMVAVECDRAKGEWLTMCGMGDAQARESRVRVRSALSQVNPDDDYTGTRVIVAPAVRGEGAFDLAIAAAAFGEVKGLTTAPNGVVFVGELGLSGQIRPVRGIIARLLAARAAGFTRAVVPPDNEQEALQVEGLEILVAKSLMQVCAWLRGGGDLYRPGPAQSSAADPPCGSPPADLADLPDGVGRRALEVAAAGSHNMLLIGGPGLGSTMMARRLTGILPTITPSEAVVMSAIHSSAGILPREPGLLTARPFRAPHHTVSEAGLIGGGDPPRPGEVSLAHGGVLFLDELPEFRRSSLDSLASALRDGEVLLCRKGRYARFPARPLIVAAAHPCLCGCDPCQCKKSAQSSAYMDRIMSGPLVATFDLVVRLPAVSVSAIRDRAPGESTRVVRARVEDARFIVGQVKSRPGLFAKVLRVARTLAALDGRKEISDANAEEAVVLCGMGELDYLSRHNPILSRLV